MSEQSVPSNSYMPSDRAYKADLRRRQNRANVGRTFFFSSNLVAFFLLIILLLHILNQSIGLVVVRNTVDPTTLADKPLEELSEAELSQILLEQLGNRIRVVVRDRYSQVPPEQFTSVTVAEAFGDSITYSEAIAETAISELPLADFAKILEDNLSSADMVDVVTNEVVKPIVIASWRFLDSVFNRAEIEALVAEQYPNDSLQFRSWISLDFITSSISSSATTAGLLTALLGSFWIIIITAILSLVVGVSAAIYLEEYATDNWINRIIEINIRNLAAIPSVIYGMLGLAVFVFALGPITSGMLFGANRPSQSEDNITRFIANAIDVNKLSETDRIALENTFLSYREMRFDNVLTYGSPSDEQIKRSIAEAIDTSLLTETEILNLEDALKRYGSFPVNGRTVFSAALTLSLLILPIIIVNAQEAIRAVPPSIREASYGLGATRWQTVSRAVIPASIGGIMTGVILSISRAVGETAPLLVVGASTFIGINPNGPFSKFTVVPIQIYQWTSNPDVQFRNVAAAAIIVLLVVMVLLNGTAIILRNRFTIRY